MIIIKRLYLKMIMTRFEMIYKLKNKIEYPKQDKLVAHALNGSIYIENGRLHINTNDMHYIYKPTVSLRGWYSRNRKTLDDYYLGEYACPLILLEEEYILDEPLWQSLLEA